MQSAVGTFTDIFAPQITPSSGIAIVRDVLDALLTVVGFGSALMWNIGPYEPRRLGNL
jgi:hypothetical protein